LENEVNVMRKRRKKPKGIGILIITLCLITYAMFSGSSDEKSVSTKHNVETSLSESVETEKPKEVQLPERTEPEKDIDIVEKSEETAPLEVSAEEPEDIVTAQDPQDSVSLSGIPEYRGQPYVEINGNVPFFTQDSAYDVTFENYSDKDALGRCGVAFVCIDANNLPTTERGLIGHIRPSGWHTVKYDFLEDRYLYNRCHLIGYQLTGNNSEENLITGTRYMNVEGMLGFENQIADYIRQTEKRVLYRVTPCYTGDNLLADGVLMEAQSLEDDNLCFCVYCYNVQPGVIINYADGSSQAEDPVAETVQKDIPADPVANEETEKQNVSIPESTTYVLNTNTMKFHYPDCGSVQDMKEKNRAFFTGNRDEVIRQGYDPCKRCNP